MIVRSRAPLRLGFAGGGTDVSPYCESFGGYVINASIDMFAHCTIEATQDSTIVFNAIDRDESFISEMISTLPIDGVLDLHKGVYNRIIKDYCNARPLSLRITTYSDAPAGSGLGSSSTMVVAILTAFVELLNLPLGEYDIAALAFQIERKDLGLSGGRQDQYAATFGGFNFMEFYPGERVIVNPLRIKEEILNELECSMVLYYTGASRDSAQIINEQIKNAESKNESAIEAMHEVKNDALILKEDLLRGQIQAFAEKLNRAWKSKKKMAKAITNSTLDKVYEYALEHGAIAGKISGAGGGGYMMFMTDPSNKLLLVNALNKLEGKTVNFHFTHQGAQSWRAKSHRKVN